MLEMKHLIFTEQSLLAFASNCVGDKFDFEKILDSKDYIILEEDDSYYFFTTNQKDSNIQSIPFVIFENTVSFEGCFFNSVQELLFRIHRIFLQFLQRKGTAFSAPSILFHCGNKLSIKAFNDKRLFLSVNVEGTKNFQAFRIASPKDDLNEFSPIIELCHKCDSLRSSLKKKYDVELEKREADSSEYKYSFNTIFGENDFSSLGYNEWINQLSVGQKVFFEKPCEKAMKLIGPAGTGKTLVMSMKLIKILKDNPDARILFTCHSWAVACQVCDFIDYVAPDLASKVDVSPILEIAKEHVHLNDKEIMVLGDDSYDGKCEQIRILSEIIVSYLKADWKFFRQECGKEFVEQIELVDKGINNFTWDLMIEITCVIGANGIMPGVNSRKKYKNLERRNWMLHLSSEAEKDVIFSLYEKFIGLMIKEKLISSDQMVNDYINYLSTYNWYYDRSKLGYDYIFVDEMQLFNGQEKMALTYLSRNSDEYPKIVMAYDPKQSVNEVYSNVGVNDIVGVLNPDSDESLGGVTPFNLDIAYRYTKQILKFLQHVDISYPQMDLENEWCNSISSLNVSKMKSGNMPQLFTYKTESEEIAKALHLAEKLSNEGCQTVILSLQEKHFKILLEQSKLNKKCHKILSRADVEILKYTKKKVLISQPNYVIGIQFDAVILVGCYSIYGKYDNNKSYYQRRFLSDLYLGASRAKKGLYLTRNLGMEDPTDCICSAVKNGLVEEILDSKK